MSQDNFDAISSAAALRPTGEQTTLSRITGFVKNEKLAKHIIEKAKLFGVHGTRLVWQFEDMELSKIRRYYDGFEPEDTECKK